MRRPPRRVRRLFSFPHGGAAGKASPAPASSLVRTPPQAAAGRAFAEADPAQRPSVIRAENGSARTIARTVLIDARAAKSAPRLDALAAAPASPDLAFWTAYHAASETLLAA